MSELATIEGEEIVIRVPFAGLVNGLDYQESAEGVPGEKRTKIVDIAEFARDVVDELNSEDGQGIALGDTPVHRLLDDAIRAAIENGSLAVEVGSEGER
jgi:hypothetical protein